MNRIILFAIFFAAFAANKAAATENPIAFETGMGRISVATDEARRLMHRVQARGSARVEVTVNTGMPLESHLDIADTPAQMARLKRAQKAVTGRLADGDTGSLNLLFMSRLPLIYMTVNENQLRRLLADPQVEHIAESSAFEFQGSLARSAGIVNANQAWRMRTPVKDGTVTGEPYEVIVIDSGMDYDHPALKGRVKSGACFSRTSGSSYGLCTDGRGRRVNRGTPVLRRKNTWQVYGRNCPAEWRDPVNGLLVANKACRHGTAIGSITRARWIGPISRMWTGTATRPRCCASTTRRTRWGP